MKTHWFGLLFFEPPPEGVPGLLMYVWAKGAHERDTPDGRRLCVGHQALTARELQGYIDGLKAELDAVAAEAKRRDAAYHRRLSRTER